MKILLVNPPCRIAWHFPVGLGYIASTARQAGWDVEILDINGCGYSKEKTEELVKDINFDIVGIGGLTSVYSYVKWFANTVKEHKPHIPVIAGNMVSTAHPEALLKNSGVDIAVIDEGELTFNELIYAIRDGKDLKGVKGIFFKDKNSNILKTGPRERITDLDALPYPAWDLFPLERYWENLTESAARLGMRSMMISATRGCPYDCVFCSHPFGRIVHARSACGLIEEIKVLKNKYDIECVNFADDLFMVNVRTVSEFCERMVSENLRIKWSVTGRVNLVTENLLRLMRRAGCVEISYGFESGSQAMLDRFHKRVTVQQAENAIKITRSSGIKLTGSFIFGMPGETVKTIQDTVEFIKRTRLRLYRFFYATPYPNTELYKIAKNMGRLPEDENRYLERLGEQRTTFLVNLTDFSDSEAVRLKNLAEQAIRKSLIFKLRLEESIEEWNRRSVLLFLSIKKRGLFGTAKKVISRVLYKMRSIYG